MALKQMKNKKISRKVELLKIAEDLLWEAIRTLLITRGFGGQRIIQKMAEKRGNPSIKKIGGQADLRNYKQTNQCSIAPI